MRKEEKKERKRREKGHHSTEAQRAPLLVRLLHPRFSRPRSPAATQAPGPNRAWVRVFPGGALASGVCGWCPPGKEKENRNLGIKERKRGGVPSPGKAERGPQPSIPVPERTQPASKHVGPGARTL